MQLNKAEKLRFILNGEQSVIKILFKEELLDTIPVYYSYNVDNLLLMKFNDESLLVIANEEYINNIGKDKLIIEILDSILSQKYNYTIADLHIAKWIGYSKTIDYLYNIGELDRANNLTKYMDSNINNLIKDMNCILSEFKYIEVV